MKGKVIRNIAEILQECFARELHRDWFLYNTPNPFKWQLFYLGDLT